MTRLASLVGNVPPSEARLLPGRASLLVPLVACLLVGLAVGLLALAASAHRAAEAWLAGVAETATLTLVAEEAEIEAQARAALAILQETEGVTAVRILEPAEQRALLAPWLGTEIAFDDLLLPLMIEVEADRGRLDAAALAERLVEAAPGAVFEDHGAWQIPRAAAAERLALLAAGGALLLIVALAGLGALAGRAAAAGAAGAADLLAGLGFTERRLARIVEGRLRAGLVGGSLAGGILAVLLILWIEPPGAAPGPGAGFAGWSWALVPLAIAAGAGLASLAAAIAARRSLVRRHGSG